MKSAGFTRSPCYNIGSRRVLEKAGFTLEGIMRRGVYKREQYFDYCMYALLREDI